MMRLFTLFLTTVLALGTTAAVADENVLYFEVTQQTSTGSSPGGSENASKVWIGKNRARMEVPVQDSLTIFDFEKEVMFNVQKKSKKYMELPFSTVIGAAAIADVSQKESASASLEAQLKKTGKTKEIAGYSCYETTAEKKTGNLTKRYTVWFSEDEKLPKGDQVEQFFEKMSRLLVDQQVRASTGTFTDKFPGQRIRMVVETIEGGRTVRQVTTFRDYKLLGKDAKAFDIPEGYTKLDFEFPVPPPNIDR